MIVYLKIISQKEIFNNIKQILQYVFFVSIIFVIMLPWTTSDIFYYMGVGELDYKYGQNPYYVTIKEYYEANRENIDDSILEKGAENVWSDTTVIYGPIRIGSNCFIGARTTILPNVTIGNNTIIGANSLVNKDIPDNVVAAGNPCKVICTLDEYRKKHSDDFLYMVSLSPDKKKEYLLKKFNIK